MGIEFRIDGLDRLAALAKQIRAEGDKGLGREMGRALTKAVQPVTKAIAASAAQTMPSGYRGELTRSLKHRRGLRTSSRLASMRLATYGQGAKQNRDLPALEAGVLRHPVYGRRKTPWATTRIRAGFHRRGIEKAGPAAEKALLGVLDDFAGRLTKG